MKVVSEIWENNTICHLIADNNNSKSDKIDKRVAENCAYKRYQLIRKNLRQKDRYAENVMACRTKQWLDASPSAMQQLSESKKDIFLVFLYGLKITYHFLLLCFH
jgi:tRNA(Ile)-lysidine synthase TilS/MesJ